MRVVTIPIIAFACFSRADSHGELDTALAADSECSSGGEGVECALNALQLRGNAMASEAADLRQEEATVVDVGGHGPKCGRVGCHSPYKRWYSCQCNERCHEHKNCCWDYDAVCAAPAPAGPPGRPQAPPQTLRPTHDEFVTAASAGAPAALCSAVPSCARLNLGGSCCPAPNGLYLGCCPESMVPHATAPPPTVVDGVDTLTVYHQTSPAACASILKTNFRIGHGGWCGDAIYFAMTPEATKTKAITPHSGIGCMLEAVVAIGKKLKFPCCRYCGGRQDEHIYWTQETLNEKGYDSIEINPGDGPEIIVYDNSQILSIKEIAFDPAWLAKRMWYRE